MLIFFFGIYVLVAGLVSFFWPGVTALALLYVIAFRAVLTGLLEIVAAISLRREIENEWLMVLSGVLTVLFGVILLVLPGAGLLSLTWLIGLYAVVFGVAFIVLGFRVRRFRTSSRVR